MSGWEQPTEPDPVVGWEAPVEPAGLGIGQSIGAGWRILRAHFGTLVGTAALPEIIRNLLVVPSVLIVVRGWDAMVQIFRDTDWSDYTDETQIAFQQRMQEAFTPPTDLAILGGVASGASITAALLGLAVVTAATLAAVDGRRPTIGGAYGAVTAHAGALIVPAVILGVGWMIVGTPLSLAQGTFYMSDPSAFRTQAAVAAVVGLLGLVLSVAIIVLVIRWSLAIPAILAEDLSLRRGLSRSAELTSGIRVRIFLIFLVLGLLVGIVFGLIALVTALVVGVATFSFTGGVAGYLIASTIGGLIWVPLGAAVLSHIYRVRAGPAATTDAAATTDGAAGSGPAWGDAAGVPGQGEAVEGQPDDPAPPLA
jgi:glycerophosphoryl diester phosphodiesterase family protein